MLWARARPPRIPAGLSLAAIDGPAADASLQGYLQWRRGLNAERFDRNHRRIGPLLARQAICLPVLVPPPIPTPTLPPVSTANPIQVLSYDKATNSYAPVAVGSADYTRYLGFWRMKVDKQTLFNVSPVSKPYENDPASDGSYSPACAYAGLKEITRQNPCNLGQIEGKNTMGSSIGPLTAKPLDDRQYRFFMEETDDGTDQSKFQGWRVVFTLVFAAKVPADAETGRFSTLPN